MSLFVRNASQTAANPVKMGQPAMLRTQSDSLCRYIFAYANTFISVCIYTVRHTHMRKPYVCICKHVDICLYEIVSI